MKYILLPILRIVIRTVLAIIINIGFLLWLLWDAKQFTTEFKRFATYDGNRRIKWFETLFSISFYEDMIFH